MLECMEILSVAAQKRINVYSVKGAWRLDQSIQSKIIAMAFSMAAEIERDLISQRGLPLEVLGAAVSERGRLNEKGAADPGKILDYYFRIHPRKARCSAS